MCHEAYCSNVVPHFLFDTLPPFTVHLIGVNFIDTMPLPQIQSICLTDFQFQWLKKNSCCSCSSNSSRIEEARHMWFYI